MSFNLDKLRDQASKEWRGLQNSRKPLITIGAATCGRSAGALDVLRVFKRELNKRKINFNIIESGCIGLCFAEPIVCIKKPHQPEIFYGNVTAQKAKQIIHADLLNGQPLVDYSLESLDNLFKHQVRRILRNCGLIDPTKINHYLANNGYSGFIKALNLTPNQVLDEIKLSGLKGRGGAGFPTWKKWQFCKQAESRVKYLICNADEGDPGAFMNRSLIEGDPHALIEGMLIAGYTLGLEQGYIYCRAEYPLALERLQLAIAQAQSHGLLGDKILGSNFSFRIKVKEGAGAFVCGEETALIASVQGERGVPRPRPPFPAVCGLWGRPTVINNVETLVSCALILNNGAKWFSEYGSQESKGTKTFALVGKIKNTGLVEVPLGITLREMIYDIGGGLIEDKKIKAVQTGGPSGGCLPESLLGLPVDYRSLKSAGSIMGSGGMVVMDESTCMVDFARFFLEFAQKESCGKCAPCRLGTKQMLQILDDITKGLGQPQDIDLLLEIAGALSESALCGLGQTAANPVLTTIRYFRDEYEAHIKHKRCPAAVCKEIISSPCQHSCPIDTEAPVYISYLARGEFKQAFKNILKGNPLPSVCARVCHHPCEQKCQAGKWTEPIAIRALKKFTSDWAIAAKIYPARKARPAKARGKVAIIGSGPAGLTAGYQLANKKYAVTIFESEPRLGGALSAYIPEYRLPRKMLNLDLENISNSGLKFKTNTKIGKDLALSQLVKEYQAVLIATGAHHSRKLNLPNQDCRGVIEAMDFLKQINYGQTQSAQGKVGVIGGGNAAVDAARSCARIKGCDQVVLIYRRTRNEMPAFKEEVEALIAEGIKIEFLLAPKRIISSQGRIKGLECLRMELREADASGRRRPDPIPGSETTIDLDTLIVAIGESPDLGFIDLNIETTKWGTIAVDQQTLATVIPGVFAAGDVVSGPNTVIAAMSQGKIAAEMIDKFIRKQKLCRDYKLTRPSVYLPAVKLSADEIEQARRPLNLELNRRMARKEARRCLRCDLETKDAQRNL
ncbi:FAD-dependent oxidoreductase [Candidatus Omnitrophota bacterium]